MIGTLGARLQSLRTRRGWSQEYLGEQADVSSRTIQRIERGERQPWAKTARRLAVALGVDVSQLYTGLSNEDIAAFQEAYVCPHCGALLEERTPLYHEYGDGEVEVFACWYTRGWQSRPCPQDPRFPELEDYELASFQEADGSWWCDAVGKTKSAREVSLQTGCGRSREEAEKWVRRSYIHARYGYEAAETFLSIGGSVSVAS